MVLVAGSEREARDREILLGRLWASRTCPCSAPIDYTWPVAFLFIEFIVVIWIMGQCSENNFLYYSFYNRLEKAAAIMSYSGCKDLVKSLSTIWDHRLKF